MEIAGKNNAALQNAFTAKDYVHDGLVVLIDAIENRGYGHHQSGTGIKYVNLIDGVEHPHGNFARYIIAQENVLSTT